MTKVWITLQKLRVFSWSLSLNLWVKRGQKVNLTVNKASYNDWRIIFRISEAKLKQASSLLKQASLASALIFNIPKFPISKF